MEDNLLNQQLDEYRLESLLGQGGMAQVYRAFDVRLKRRVAIKVIDPPFQNDPEYVARFEREAQAIALLKHPNIVGIYRVGEANGLLYLAMEYIDGVTLEDELADYHRGGQTMPAPEVNRIIRQSCLALDYAHQQGVIHRDVKPSNIMLNKQGQVILTDFGLALLTEVGTRGETFGTPHYLSPEQVVSSAGAVPQSDLYAVGVMLFEIFTGQLPFQAAHPFDVALLHLTEPPPEPRQLQPHLSPALEAVILKSLAKKPEERYPTGVALADALAEALQAEIAPTQPRAVVKVVVAPASPPPLPPPPPAPAEGKVIPTRYILANIRALLLAWTEGFSEQQLRQLYIDLPDFRPVHQQLARTQGKANIIDRLLEYAEQTLQLDELLALARQHNPALYEKHQPYLELTSMGRRDLIGLDLGKYHLVERLGQGGMADVYKAYQPGLSRFVAIKVIHSHLADNEELLERFESEAMAVANLRHPNIVQVFDFDRLDNLYYMVMELVDGPTLEVELKSYQAKNQPYPLAETAAIFQALGSAIDYAHSRGMIHRDLKPGNIMFTARRRVVLTDFGIARFVDRPSYTVTNAVVGTPAYMSPEQAQGEPIDSRSDIFSLGVILYEMLTGRIPFEGDNAIAVILKLVSDSFPPPSALKPDLAPEVEQVILKAMSKQPANRYPTAGEMALALQTAIVSPRLPAPPADRLALKVQPPIPEIELKPTPLAGKPETPGGVNLAGISGQFVFGQNNIQLGNISGGQITIGPANPAGQIQPAAPTPGSLSLEQQLFKLKIRVEVEAPAAKKAAALERLAELEETLTAPAPDLETVTYLKNWFAKNIPALAEAINEVIAYRLKQ